MKILALDCGRQTGWAVLRGKTLRYGTWDFTQDYNWLPEAAGWSLHQRVDETIVRELPDLVAIERPFGFNAASVVEASEMAMLAAVAAFGRDLRAVKLPPATIRKSFCGSGRATKKTVIAECVRRGFYPANDHEADAIALAFAALERATEEHPA